MKKVTTTSDVELIIVPLNKDGQDKVNKGESIDNSNLLGIDSKYYKIRCKLGFVEFIAIHNTDNSCRNCYESTVDIGGLSNVPCIVITIPSNTFRTAGNLEIAFRTSEPNVNFPDNTKDTESVFEKTEVYYVSQ